VHLVDFVIKK